MTTYSKALPQNLTKVSELGESGTITPSHGGTVIAGHEYDLPIAQVQQPSSSSNKTVMPESPQTPRSAQLPPQRDQLQPLPTAIPRSSGTSSRPRPVSMPPQSYNPAAGVPPSTNGEKESSTQETRPRQHREGSTSKSGRSSNRILGDYTLSKTLGAGSMGKVKLATHNITGEKVSSLLSPIIWNTSLTERLFSACCQNPSPCIPTSSERQWRKSYTRGRCQAGIQGCIQRNPDDARGCFVIAASPPLHMWHAGNDRSPTSLLHGFRVRQWRADAGLYY